MKQVGLCALVLTVSFLLAGCGGESTTAVTGPESQLPATEASEDAGEQTWKVALCTSGPINDNDWNALAYEGLVLIGEKHNVEINYVESIKESDQAEIIRNFATQGYNVIFAHGYEFGDSMMTIAEDFPDCKFIITSADITNGKNLSGCNINNREQGFLVGAAAALVSENNHIAILGSIEMPPIEATIEGFTAGAEYVAPGTKASAGYIGSYNDAAKAKEMMRAFVQDGADVGACVADMAALGGIEALREEDALCIGLNRNQGVIAPDHVVTNIGQSYAIAMDAVFQKILDGTYEGTSYNEGVESGAIFIIPNEQYDVPQEVQAELDRVFEEIREGKIDAVK